MLSKAESLEPDFPLMVAMGRRHLLEIQAGRKGVYLKTPDQAYFICS
jgi:hypothetical protein